MSSRLWLLLVFALASVFAPSRTCAYAAETRTGDFLSEVNEVRPESAAQVADSHLANTVFGYETVSGYALAAETAGAETAGADIANLRRAAVRDAWAQERQLVQETGQGTRNWTDAEVDELLENGKVSGYQGHHINSVSAYPELAGNPDNIRFLTPAEHFEVHDFNWQNPTSGPLIYRQ
jgi:hypothetical protein